ncbi:hypothetical protein K353_00150 [Kitasatospora sp. SolWspMP-SS2h]|uniref:DUF6296 family protein n=1 Tax=Kitasatospora sp. SolWspMP-SS2h TaxID=1305729 RepID=UPI000DBAC167|nr:DUF6296 family protein [Kitasatospora sp. SolWspMP-SS2h]RAJ46949.1 hypothetical protein K353_00150 [Kitasatospora sp. SolWspMP-SS2h]
MSTDSRTRPERYTATLPGRPGTHGRARTVTVHRTGRTGPGGGAAYPDADGTFLVEVTGQVASPLPPSHGSGLPVVLPAHPMP